MAVTCIRGSYLGARKEHRKNRRLTVSRPCANVTLLIRRVAHLIILRVVDLQASFPLLTPQNLGESCQADLLERLVQLAVDSQQVFYHSGQNGARRAAL